MNRFEIDFALQNEIKEFLEMAKVYCEENIPKTDPWSKTVLQTKLDTLNELIKSAGYSFVVGRFE